MDIYFRDEMLQLAEKDTFDSSVLGEEVRGVEVAKRHGEQVKHKR